MRFLTSLFLALAVALALVLLHLRGVMLDFEDGSSFPRTLNLALWLGVLGALWLALRRVRTPAWGLPVLLGVLALHPALANAVARPASTPYLVAAFCILLSTHQVLRLTQMESRWALLSLPVILVSYTVAVYNHPTSFLWPLWVLLLGALHGRQARWGRLLALLGLCIPSVLQGLGFFLSFGMFHVSYRPLAPAETVYRVMMGAGRAILQLVLPLFLDGTYTSKFFLEAAALVGASLLVRQAWRHLPRREVILWLGFLLVMLAPPLLREDDTFFRDAYLFIPLLGVAALSVIALEQVREALDASSQVTLGVLCAGLLVAGWGLGHGQVKEGYTEEPPCEVGKRGETPSEMDCPPSKLERVQFRKRYIPVTYEEEE